MQKFRKLLFPVFAAISIFVLSAAEIYNMRPFGTGAYLALLTAGVPIYVIAPVYLLSQAAFVPVTEELWGYAAVCVSGVIVSLICSRFKKRVPLYGAAAVGTVGSCGFIYAGVIGALTPLNIILSASFSLLFMLVCSVFLKPLAARDAYARFTEPELMSGGAVLAAAFIALSRPFYETVTLYPLAAAFVTLCALRVYGVGTGMVCALAMGCGAALGTGSASPIAVLAFAAAIAAVFCRGHRLILTAGYILGFTVATFLFSESGAYALISALIGSVAYAALPDKTLKKLLSSGEGGEKAALIASYNRERRRASGELMTAADIFGQMSRVMSTASGIVTKSDTYAARLMSEVCAACPHGNDCAARKTDVFVRLVERALADGTVSVGGMPEEVLSHCRNLASLAGKVNAFVVNERAERSRFEAYDTAAKLCSVQLGGAEGLMRRLGAALGGEAVFDTAGEEKIRDELTYGGCSCLGVTVRVTGGDREVSAIVRAADFDKSRVCAALKKLYRRPFFFVSSDTAYAPDGYLSVRFKSGAPLDVVFGVSQIGKDGSGYIGDKYSFTRIGASGFMMAVSDGMGTGKKASDVSETALSLIENYYRAGFGSEFVLASVNRFLSLAESDSFSAMDILVLNLCSACGDIIKIGSPYTRIRRGGRVARVGGGSLPLGALEEITPYSESVRFEEGDMIVMLSDGVEDAFDGSELDALIQSETTLNPQTLSRNLLDAALKRYGGVQRDDMTVICGRIFAP